MNFNFNETAGAAQSTSLPVLSGNTIHEVTFVGVEERDIIGVKDTSAVYKVLDIKFNNPKGYFTHTIWEPKETDFARRENTNKPGKMFESPSNVENMQLLFKHLIDGVNPILGKQIDEGKAGDKMKIIGNSISEKWLNLRKLMVAATASGKGIQTKIKLILNKKGEVIFPYFSMLDKNSEAPYKAIVVGNFIGDNVYFSSYEKGQIDKAANAVPTPAAASIEIVTASENVGMEAVVEFNL